LKTKPTKNQELAITHSLSPLMIIAGAGTGKTFTLERRILYLINHHKVNPNNILAITYTEKAARELKQRIIDKTGEKASKMTVNTFHSYCYKILKDFSNEQLPSLIEQSESIHMLLSKFDELQPFHSDLYALNPQKAILESFIPLFDRIKDELINLDLISIEELQSDDLISNEIICQLKDIKRIYPLFQNWKKKLNVIDYGDMIYLAYQLLKSNKSILKEVQNQFRHIIVDEFQDNNFALNTIITMISGKRQSITVVGDDDQVIYSFRGANSYNISNFKSNYKHNPNFKAISLEENFRSNQPILDLANYTIKKNNDRIDKVLFSNIKNLKKLPRQFFGNESDQNQFLINEINYLVKNNYSYHQIAILCRTHNQCKKVSTILKKSGIPVNPTYPDFFGITAIRDIISWSQLIGGGYLIDSALFRIMKSKMGYKIATTIFQTFNKKSKIPRINLLLSNQTLINKYPQLKIIIDDLKYYNSLIKKRSVGQLIWEIVKNQISLTDAAKRYSMDDQFLLLNIGKFLKMSQDFTKRNKRSNTLSHFNKYLDAIMNSGSNPSVKPINYKNLKGLLINTVHGVKGGEFPIVFLPYQRSGSFPLNYRSNKFISKPPDSWLKYSQSSSISEKEHHYEEERRLFYVAITRAIERLYLLAPKKATSKFIKEIPSNLTEIKKMSDDNIEIKNSSDLKIKYEDFLQKALANESYDEVNAISIILSKLKNISLGKNIKFENNYWDNKLKNDLKNKFIIETPEKIYLSASAIDTYKSCPLKFRLSKFDGIPQNASKPELIFGNIIHSVLQRFHEPNKELSNNRILRLLNEEWKKDEFDYKVREERFKQQGIDILKQYCILVRLKPPKVLKREEKFSFDIEQITIAGAIDRIDQENEGISIIDYKTSKTASSPKSSLQLAIYCMYLSQLNDNLIGGLPKKASLYFLRDNEKPIREHTFNFLELKVVEKKIKDVANGIRNKEFEAKKGKHCDWCDYKDLLCPAWEK
jgi:DNA helicase II / ATP-dependent DNA helicase PcrA